MKIQTFQFLAVFAATILAASDCFAYDNAAITDVKGRVAQRDEGVNIGAFILKPSLGLMQSYDDNIYRTKNNRQKDMITTATASAKIQSNWNLHQIEAGGSADFKRYHDNKSEDNDNFAFYISGRYDIDYETYFTALLRSEILHEDRSSLDDVDGDEPIEYAVHMADLGFTRALGILKLYMNANLSSYDYNNSVRSGVSVDNNDRDRHQASFKTRVAYSVSDNSQAFAQITYNKKNYQNDSISFKDSHGLDYRIGLSANLTGKVEGEVFAGYLTQNYSDRYSGIHAPSFGGAMLWNITELTSLKTSLERQVLETSLANSSGIVRTNFELALQHALTPDVLLEANFGLDDDTYKGDAATSSGRDNITYRSEAAVGYQFGRGFSSRLSYDFIKRNFKSNDNGYENSKIMASVVYKY